MSSSIASMIRESGSRTHPCSHYPNRCCHGATDRGRPIGRVDGPGSGSDQDVADPSGSDASAGRGRRSHHREAGSSSPTPTGPPPPRSSRRRAPRGGRSGWGGRRTSGRLSCPPPPSVGCTANSAGGRAKINQSWPGIDRGVPQDVPEERPVRRGIGAVDHHVCSEDHRRRVLPSGFRAPSLPQGPPSPDPPQSPTAPRRTVREERREVPALLLVGCRLHREAIGRTSRAGRGTWEHSARHAQRSRRPALAARAGSVRSIPGLGGYDEESGAV